MAKLTALQIMNKVLDNCGQAQVTVLTGLTGINNVALNMVQNVLLEIATNDDWKQLEVRVDIDLVNGTQIYAKPSDFRKINKRSLVYNQTSEVTWLDPYEIDSKYADQDVSGDPPLYIWDVADNFLIYPVPNANSGGKSIDYRYWKIPSRIDTASPSGTVWFPEPFEELVLVNLATARVLSYRSNQEANVYSGLVYGVRGSYRGALNDMKSSHLSQDFFKVKVKN